MSKKVIKKRVTLAKAKAYIKLPAGLVEWIGTEDGDVYEVELEFKHGAWQCPFCGEAQEYYTINDQVIKGSGGQWMGSGGHESSACSKRDCQRAQEEWHESRSD